MSYAAMGDLSYVIKTVPHAASIAMGHLYANPWPVAYPAEPQMPVPGWGFTPNLAGRERVGVGADPVVTATMQRRLFVAPLIVGVIAYMASPKQKPLYGALGALAALIVASGLEKSGA